MDDEKNDETALKFMCIIDYEIERNGLYEKIKNTNYPKLFEELLCFHSYKNFTYYEYKDSPFLNGKNVQCCRCELFGTYTSILTHIAINHDLHIGNRLCFYCGKKELKIHFEEESLQKCYEEYLLSKNITEVELGAIAVHKVITEFYDVMKSFSKSMGVLIVRKLHSYTAKGRYKPDKILENFDDEDPYSTVLRVAYRQSPPKKSIALTSKRRLEDVFKIAIDSLRGGDAYSRFIQSVPEHLSEDDTAPIGYQEQYQPRRSGIFSRTSNVSMVNIPTARSASVMTLNEVRTEPFVAYLSQILSEIPNFEARRKTEKDLLEVAMKARLSQGNK
ncbi:uncharacterized protein LOC119068136 [Bradysia coprophila]|uniref:uncharacterized protein LOC119068136 n=1 Tax=Bradysia coprophila TaxID=38358 RepID=UPI00187D9B42|nr:uncharacterized protein LOC119068136 [Bradysia coprophila]